MKSIKEQSVVVVCVLDPKWVDEFEAADETGRQALRMAPRFIPSPRYHYAADPHQRMGEWQLSIYSCPDTEIYPEWPNPRPEAA